ncbi:PilZ domain-containing protein [Desulfoluna sp.]|uniref:PilZ domain-containing protein n=1 Tax=Desulfoluna sp. TaxID=2045199 RepID=UPI00261B9133|nr:PilZ domain-containing protein [Desulfoluna sp.]
METLNLSRDTQGIRLNIELGSSMRFMLEGTEAPVKGVLVGLEPLEYLIVRLDLPVEFMDRVQKEALLAVSYMSLGNEYGFTSSIIDHIHQPDRLIFISYPSVIQNIDVRKSSRVSCFIPATAHVDTRRIKGNIIDISQGGCRFIIRLPATLQARQIRLIDTMELLFPLLGIDGLQAVTGQVCNTTIDRERIAMGIEFVNPDRDLVKRIDHYIATITQIQTAP